MTTAVNEEQLMEENFNQTSLIDEKKYSCQILLEKTTGTDLSFNP